MANIKPIEQDALLNTRVSSNLLAQVNDHVRNTGWDRSELIRTLLQFAMENPQWTPILKNPPIANPRSARNPKQRELPLGVPVVKREKSPTEHPRDPRQLYDGTVEREIAASNERDKRRKADDDLAISFL